MIPKINGLNISTKIMPAKTYDINTGRVIDKLDALTQSVYLMLSVERYERIIYSWRYGFESFDLYGKDFDYVKLELKRRIKEALIIDDRINDVIDFEFEQNKRDLLIMFTVKSIYGDIKANKAVIL